MCVCVYLHVFLADIQNNCASQVLFVNSIGHCYCSAVSFTLWHWTKKDNDSRFKMWHIFFTISVSSNSNRKKKHTHMKVEVHTNHHGNDEHWNSMAMKLKTSKRAKRNETNKTKIEICIWVANKSANDIIQKRNTKWISNAIFLNERTTTYGMNELGMKNCLCQFSPRGIFIRLIFRLSFDGVCLCAALFVFHFVRSSSFWSDRSLALSMSSAGQTPNMMCNCVHPIISAKHFDYFHNDDDEYIYFFHLHLYMLMRLLVILAILLDLNYIFTKIIFRLTVEIEW